MSEPGALPPPLPPFSQPTSEGTKAPTLGWVLRRSALLALCLTFGVFTACMLYGAASKAELPDDAPETYAARK